MKKIIFTLTLFFALSFGQKVFAHATPVEYTPSASAVLSSQPSEIAIRFSERVEPSASSIFVLDPDGKELSLGVASVDSSDRHIFRLPFKTKQLGSFVVSWQVVSADDGHFTKGAFGFSVGVESKNSTSLETGFQIVHSSNLPEALAIGLEIFAGAVLLGLLTILFWLWPRWKKRLSEPESLEIEKAIVKKSKQLIIFSAILTVASVAGYFYIKIFDLMQVSQSSSVSADFFGTASAKYALLRLALILLVLVLLWLDLKKDTLVFSKTKQVVYLVLFFLISLARARISHAVASHFVPNFSVLVNTIHLIFKDLWIGGLFCYLYFFSKFSRTDKTHFTVSSLVDFSKVVLVAFLGGATTGAYIVWLHLKSWDNVLLSDWGLRFLLLGAFGGILFLTRVVIFSVLQPAVFKNKNWAKSFLSVFLPFEAVVGFFVLIITGLLIITTPPVGEIAVFSQSHTSQNLKIQLKQSQAEEGKLNILVLDKNGLQTELQNLVVALNNSEKNIGPIVADTTKRAMSSFVLDQKLLSPPGNWSVEVSAERKNGYSSVAKFQINTQNDLLGTLSESKRKLDNFAWVFIVLSILAGMFALLWYWQILKQEALAKQSVAENIGLVRFSAIVFSCITALFFLQILASPVAIKTPKILESGFQKFCEKNGDMWHNSVPMRQGKALSAESKNGCMVGLGLGANHFVDLEEYKYFIRPAQASVYLVTDPKVPEVGKKVLLKINIKDLDGKPVKELSLDHDRILHTIIINQDFSVFSHIHAEDFPELNKNSGESAEFILPYTFPKPGKYLIATDYMVRNKTFSESFYVSVSEENKSSGVILRSVSDEESLKFLIQKNFEGLDVSLTLNSKEPKAKEKIDLLYIFKQNGKDVKNLESYLSVPMHLAVVREDLFNFQHVHGWLPFTFWEKFTGQTIHAQHLALPKNFGPEITTQIVFPTPGIYHIFGQVKQNGKVIDTYFVVKVK